LAKNKQPPPFSFKKLTFAFLKTQKTREALVKRLQRRLEIAEKEADRAEDPAVKAEWSRLIGFLTQTLNGLLKAYDSVRFNEDMQELKRLVEMAKREHERLQRWQEQLEARERALAIKEEEVNRKLDALAKQQTGGGANL
jgi:chromosome segregation ATPase